MQTCKNAITLLSATEGRHQCTHLLRTRNRAIYACLDSRGARQLAPGRASQVLASPKGKKDKKRKGKKPVRGPRCCACY